MITPAPPAATDRAISIAARRGSVAGARAVLRALRDRLGAITTARVLLRVARDRVRGEPLRALPPPRDDRERRSRAQLRDVVLLDRALRAATDDATALALCRVAVHAGGVAFLDAMLPATDLAARAAEVAGWFFNATGTVSQVDDELRFDVTACDFARLLPRLGAGHLAPLFCEVDRIYFDEPRRGVLLRRSRTLATGGDGCDFRFRAR